MIVIAFRLMVLDRLDHWRDCLAKCEVLNTSVMWTIHLSRKSPPGFSPPVKVYSPIAQCPYKRGLYSVMIPACSVVEADLFYPCEIESSCL